MKKYIIGFIALITIAVAVLIFTGIKSTSKFTNIAYEPYTDIQDKELRRAKSNFFRLKADYEITSSGEIVSFDYIFACSKIIHETKYDTGTVDSGPVVKINILFPESVFMPTSSGAALQVSTFKICQASNLAGYEGTPHPYTIFHPDINDLSTGWGYATYHAYERPNADLRFLGGSVNYSNKSEFADWLKKANREFDPNSGLPNPYGLFGSDIAKKWKVEYRQEYQLETATHRRCRGKYHYPIPEDIKPALNLLRPKNNSRFWSAYEPRDNTQEQRDLVKEVNKRHTKINRANKFMRFKSEYRPEEGTPASDGTGTLTERPPSPYSYKGLKPTPVYPYLDYVLQKWPDDVEMDLEVIPASILFDDNYKGLEFCVSTSMWNSSSGYARGKTRTLFIQGHAVDGTRGPIFDSEGGVFK